LFLFVVAGWVLFTVTGIWVPTLQTDLPDLRF